MKSFSFAKALTLGCLISITLPIACGGDDDTSNKPTPTTGGAGGENPGAGGMAEQAAGAGGMSTMMLPPGLSDKTSTVMCMDKPACNAVQVGTVFVDPCCDADKACGLDTGFFALVGHPFKDKCEAHAQKGVADTTCKSVKGLVVNFSETIKIPVDELAGCCRDDGKCGVVLDQVKSMGTTIANLQLGCVDAAPFNNNAETSCGMGGAGGAGGNGGGGAPAAGGAGGAGGAG